MSTKSNTVHHELESLRAKISLDLEYVPVEGMNSNLDASAFSVVATSAVLTLLAQLDDATSEHPKFRRRKRPIEVVARHSLGIVQGRLTIDAHLCPEGMLMVTRSFADLLPALIDMELEMRSGPLVVVRF